MLSVSKGKLQQRNSQMRLKSRQTQAIRFF